MLWELMSKVGGSNRKPHNQVQRLHVQKVHFEDGIFKTGMSRTCLRISLQVGEPIGGSQGCKMWQYLLCSPAEARWQRRSHRSVKLRQWVNSWALGTDGLGLLSFWLCYLLAVHGLGKLLPFCVYVIVFKMKIIVPTSQGYCGKEMWSHFWSA